MHVHKTIQLIVLHAAWHRKLAVATQLPEGGHVLPDGVGWDVFGQFEVVCFVYFGYAVPVVEEL